MKRIDTKDGLFDDGNHVFGIHGTRVSAEFLNDIQEEIVNVIGARNLDGSKRDQLITAIRNIVKSGGGSSSGSAITQADQDKIDSSYHKLKHFVEDELGIALDAKNDAQLKTAIDSAIAKLQAQLDVIKADIRKKMTNGGTVPLATETTAGVAEIATQDEANNGNDDSKIITPKKLKGITDNLIKDRATLETSIRTKLTQLDGVDSDLRKDTDGNTSDIAQLKATETADIKGVIDKITKLTATDTGGVATLTKAISDLAKKEKSDIAGIKTQQQTNTTAINDLKNKTVTLIDASETTKGVAEIATQNEANDGNDDSKIVTPKKLKVITSDLDRRATRIRNDVDRNTADLVTHRTDIQQNTTDIVSNTASIATIINTIKKGITTDKLAQSFTVPSVLHDKIQLDGEENAGNYGYAVAMNYYHLAIADTVNQEVVIYHRNDNNKKLWELEDVHKGKKHGDIFVEDGQVYAKRKDGVHLDVFEYDETQTNLTFKKVSTINLTGSFGKSLAIDDEYLIVGNPQASTALIYKHSGIQWQLVEKLSGGTSFGSDVAINHKYILVSELANKKAEVYKISRTFDFSNEKTTGRFKVKADVYLNAPAASTAGFLGYTVADDDSVNYSQIAQNLDDNAVYVRHFSAGNNGAWSSSDIAAFKQKTNLNTRTNQNDYVQRYYSTNQVNKKLMIGFCFQQHSSILTSYEFTGHLFIEVETNKIYYHCYDNKGGSWVTEISYKLKIDEFKKMMSFTNRVLPYVLSTTVEAVNGFKATVDTYGKAGSGKSDINTFITFEENNVKKSFQLTVDEEATVYLNTKTGGAWSGWSNIAGTRPADPIQLEVLPPAAIKHFKTLTGGASYSKVIDLNAELSAFAEPDNNILKIYENLAEIASKTVKADCVSVGTGIVLATSKTDKKAYIYDFYSKTGWFTTTRTKWAGIADNANGYTGYNITGGQYQLVRPVGTTDTYTKYNSGAWVKNGTWGGVLWYLGSKIGFDNGGDNQWHLKGIAKQFKVNSWRTGLKLSSDGSRVVVGAYKGNYCEIYAYKNGVWSLLGSRLTGSGRFGFSCSISSDGSRVAVGAYDGNYCEIYAYKNGVWSLLGSRLTGSGDFGFSCSISSDGSRVAVGAYDGNYCEIYEYKNGVWSLLGSRLTGSGRFGYSCSLSEDGLKVAVGVYAGNYCEIYAYKNGVWSLLGSRLTGSGRFGFSCSISSDGTRVAVGADNANYCEIYTYKNGVWSLLGSRLTGSGRFGYSCSLSSDGTRVAVGADGNYAEVYDFINNKWTLVGKRLTGTGDFGDIISLSADGSTVAIGNDTSYSEVYSFNTNKQLYLETTDGKHYYDNKELKDATKFDTLMETVAPLATLPELIPQANRNLKLTEKDIQEQPNKTGAYVSLLGTGTATTAKSIDDANFTIGNNYGDACAITADKILITNKTDSKLAIYDHKGTKQKEIQLEVGVGSVIDATDTEAIVGSEKANKFDVINLKI